MFSLIQDQFSEFYDGNLDIPFQVYSYEHQPQYCKKSMQKKSQSVLPYHALCYKTQRHLKFSAWAENDPPTKQSNFYKLGTVASSLEELVLIKKLNKLPLNKEARNVSICEFSITI